MILPGCKEPSNCVDPRNLGMSEWDQMLGKIECVFSLYDKMRWKWDAAYLPRDLANIYSHSTSVTRVSPYTHRRFWTLYLEAEIELVSGCAWRPWSIEFGNALGGRDQASSDMHLEVEMEWTQRCTWRPWSREFEHALGGRDQVNSEMHSEAVTERVWRCTCRLWSSEIGRVLGRGRFGGRRDGSWDSIHCLTCNCGNVESWVQHPPRDGKLAGSGKLSILGWCCTWCMLYSVLTHDYAMER